MPFSNSTIPNINPTTLKTWSILQQSFDKAKSMHLHDHFKKDPDRSKQLTFEGAGLIVDLSRQHINDSILAQLTQLADDCGFNKARQALFDKALLNFTEGRAACHTEQRLSSDGTISTEITNIRTKIRDITRRIHSGQWHGYTDKKITDIVNIGIGGSELGPKMVCAALKPYHNSDIKVHFVSNLDPCDIEQVLHQLNPETTIFIIASKSWSTLETLANAKIARQWLLDHSNNDQTIDNHFIAISSRPDKCIEFGISRDHVLPMQEGVGGRYSLWSAIGLTIALATSFEHFENLLAGAHAMDKHFRLADNNKNLPLLLALVEIWQVNFWGYRTVVNLPYNHNLRLLPDYLQQLAMESNGKQVDRLGQPVSYATCPIVWGAAGTNGQHSFHQLLHQGTHSAPAEFILPVNTESHLSEQQKQLIANCLAQAQALMDGVDVETCTAQLSKTELNYIEAKQLAQHKSIPGNRPSTIITMESLTPYSLGSLLSMYEHKVFCQSVIWNINAFDQWGVELGKEISPKIYSAMNGQQDCSNNPATNYSIKTIMDLINNQDSDNE